MGGVAGTTDHAVLPGPSGVIANVIELCLMPADGQSSSARSDPRSVQTLVRAKGCGEVRWDIPLLRRDRQSDLLMACRGFDSSIPTRNERRKRPSATTARHRQAPVVGLALVTDRPFPIQEREFRRFQQTNAARCCWSSIDGALRSN